MDDLTKSIVCKVLSFSPENSNRIGIFSDPGLGLDSLEALEIASELSRVYNVSFDGVKPEIFQSVETLADFILLKNKSNELAVN
ncbi:MAG: acyl carrier protein [Pseudobacteriovorax sp.]|nr:acyl carrier protein [Pseudobacteriovorax sp.]